MTYTKDKTVQMKFRCNEKQKEKIKLLADAAGLTVSAYILGVATAENKTKKSRSKIDGNSRT